MKKFLVLSFLMVLFAAAVSFAQTRTVNHYKSNPAAAVYISSYECHNPPLAGPNVYYCGMTISPWSPGDINYTNAYVYIKFLNGGEIERYNFIEGSDGAFADFVWDTAEIEYVVWSLELSCTNGDTEIIDIFDVYN